MRWIIKGADPASCPNYERLYGRQAGIRPAKADPLLLTEEQAADRLGCSVKTLRAHIIAGELRCVQIGRGRERIRRKFTIADIE
jgi:excisionase family DNA binding protein